MRILDRYVWKELVTPFCLGLLIFTFLLLIDRIFDLTDLIINKGVPVHLVLMMLVYISPAILVLTIPIGFLLSILVAFGRLSSDMEVVALKACGVSPLRPLPILPHWGRGTDGPQVRWWRGPVRRFPAPPPSAPGSSPGPATSPRGGGS